MKHAPVSWRFAALPGLFLALCYLLTFPGTIGPRISDGRSMYLVTQALVDRHDVALADPYEPTLAHGWQPPPPPGPPSCPTEPTVIGVGREVGGPVFSKFGLGQSLAAIPLYLLGEHLAPLAAPPNRPEVTVFVTSAYNALITALTAILLCALALRLGWSRRVAIALALLFGLATPAWSYTTTFFSEPTIGLCLLAALASVLWHEGGPSPRTALLAGAWLGAAILVRLDSAFYVPVFAAYLLYRRRREEPEDRQPASWARLLVALTVGPALGLATVGGYNLARFGSVTESGYGISGDYHDLHPPHSLQALWEGIYGPLLSPGKGLFLYAPILLLLPWALVSFARGGRRTAAWLVLAIAAIAVLTHANTLIVWLGGWAWGPRFLIPVVPVLLLPLGALFQQAGPTARRLAWALGFLGVLIQVPGVLLEKGAYIRHLNAQQGGCIWHAEDLYKWHPQYTPLIGQWQRLLDARTYAGQATNLQEAVAALSIQTHRPGITAQIAFAAGRYTPAPQAWWAALAAQGVSSRLLAVPLLALGLLGALVLLLAVRALGPPSARPTSAEPVVPPQRVIVRH